MILVNARSPESYAMALSEDGGMTVRLDVRGSPAIHKGKGTLRGARIAGVGPRTGRPRAGTMTYGAAHAGTAAMADAEGS
jgi:hypothetical protein